MEANRFETFGKYVLLEKLAMGGMAEVYLARSIGAGGVGKFVAIKRILPQFSEQSEFVDMFKDEAAIAINLQHSNIVTLHEFGVEKSQFFIAMDFVNGRNLKQILGKAKQANRTLSIEQIVYVCKEIAAGLDHAHRCLNPATAKPLNIIHRDMSPHNVMISFDGEIKVVDFGIAKAETQIESTRAGTLKGKFGYMSPEQADAQEVDQRTDIFSLGIILWELLANDRLFVGKNEIEILRKIKECNIQPLRKLNANIPPELEKIVGKALSKDRNMRYRNAEDFHRELHRFLNVKYPDFSKADFSKFMKELFNKEIEDGHRKLLEYAKTDFAPLLKSKRSQAAIEALPVADQTPGTQKSISHGAPRGGRLERQLERRPESKKLLDEPIASDSPFEIREGLKQNVLEVKSSADMKGDGGLKIDPSHSPKRAANPYATATGNPSLGSGNGNNTYYGTRSRLENSSYHKQASSTASLIAVIMILGVIIGGGLYYFTNPERANKLMTQLLQQDKPGTKELSSEGQTHPVVAAPRMVDLPVTSNPPGAEILVAGRPSGELTPSRVSLEEGKRVAITLRLHNHLKWEEEVEVRPGKTVMAVLKKDRKGYLDISVMGAGEISIDGRVIAATGPVSGFPIPAEQEVVVRVFDPQTKAMDEARVKVQEDTTRRITLIPRANIHDPRRPAGK